jgi:hypothetical protein
MSKNIILQDFKVNFILQQKVGQLLLVI